ncbi:MAG: beta-ketoacyl synthase chain length factor [Pseudomonadota bacterium]
MNWAVYVNAVGFVAPGLDTAADLHAHLNGVTVTEPQGWTPAPISLNPRQARRLSESIKLSIQCAEQIAPALPPGAGWVFASSVGEGVTLNEILSALRQPDVMIQPVKFQNAVHNAAQGQWSIAAQAAGPGTSLAAYDDTFAAGLLKAGMQVALEGIPVGVVAFDAPLPPPLHEKRAFALSMAAGLALSPEPTDGTLAALDLSCAAAADAPVPGSPNAADWLTESNNPVRAAIPLLERLLHKDPEPLALPVSRGTVLNVVPRYD